MTIPKDLVAWLRSPQCGLLGDERVQEAADLIEKFAVSETASPLDAKELANLVIMDVSEIPDRTSPDDFPQAMLVTGPELRHIIEGRCEYLREMARTALPSAERPNAVPFEKLMERQMAESPVFLPRAIAILNTVKAWRDCDGNDGFPHDVREQIDALLMAYELREQEKRRG